MRKAATTFLLVALLAISIQAGRLFRVPVYDQHVWSDHAGFVRTGDARQFETMMAYGHPGGPLVTGGIAVQALPGISDYHAFTLLLSVLNGLAVAAICAVCFALRRNVWWGAGAFLALSLHGSFAEGTPPSLLAAYLSTLLAVLTLYWYERPERRALVWSWAAVAGLLISTRFDVGVFFIGIFGILLLTRVPWQKLLGAGGVILLIFVATDPFFWFMPVQHAQDLLFKVFYHYAEFPIPTALPLPLVLQFSAFGLLSVALALTMILFRRRLGTVLPLPYLGVLLGATAVLYAVYLTAVYQAERYFLPILFIWETLLPLFLFHLISMTTYQERTKRALMALCILFLMIYPLFFIGCYYANPTGPTCTV